MENLHAHIPADPGDANKRIAERKNTRKTPVDRITYVTNAAGDRILDFVTNKTTYTCNKLTVMTNSISSGRPLL